MIKASIREDFPLLSRTIQGKHITYMDNACMSLRPQPVIDEISKYYTHLSSCAGRSNHSLSQELEEAVHNAREGVASFIGAKKTEEVVFVRNTSEGLNLVAQSLDLKKGDRVITTDKEHNSNLVPWLKLKKDKGIEHVVLASTEDNLFDLLELKKALDKGARLVSVVHTSNLDGVSVPLKEIVELSHKAGALVMVDAAQSAPHYPLNVADLDVDFLAFSAHKLCGPSGMGVLFGKYELLENLEGFMVGGDTVEYTTYTDYALLPPPEKFEAGLQNYAGILGTGAAVSYLSQIGMDAIHEHEVALNTLLSEELQDVQEIELIGPKDPSLRGGIFSFYVPGVDSHEIALLLNEQGIMVRSGRHCVHSWFDSKGIENGCRASLYFYNTEKEVRQFASALKEIVAVLT